MKKYFIPITLLLAIIIGGIVLLKTTQSKPIQTTENKEINYKTYQHPLLKFSFKYPENYTITVESKNDTWPFTFIGKILNEAQTYHYNFYDFNSYESNASRYKTREMDNGGILYWNSFGSGPYECYEEMECPDPYSDEFQFGALFQLENGAPLSFHNSYHFRDNQAEHSLADVQNIDIFQDWFTLIETVKIIQ